VTTKMMSYTRLHETRGTALGTEPLDLPERSYETCGLWLTLPSEVRESVTQDGGDVLGGLHALEHAAIAMLPLYALCESLDVGGASHASHPDTSAPSVFIYDVYPGGVGIAERAYDSLEDVVAAAHAAVADCLCESGCPSCIQSPFCGDNNQPLDKPASLCIMRSLLGLDRGDVP